MGLRRLYKNFMARRRAAEAPVVAVAPSPPAPHVPPPVPVLNPPLSAREERVFAQLTAKGSEA